MKKISKSERLQYWKFLCAEFSLDKAKGIASELLEIGYDDKLFYPLLTSLYIFYGRPFKQRKQVRLSTEIIPKRFKKLHETLILLRDKSFAHVDSDRMPEMGSDNLNRVMVRIKGATVTCGIANHIEQGLQLENVISLCDELLKKCSYHSEKIWQKSMKHWNSANGEYEVNLDDGDGYLIKKLEIRGPIMPPDAVRHR